MPSNASPIELDTNVVIIPPFLFSLTLGVIVILSPSLGYYAQCYYMNLSIFYSKLQKAQFSCKGFQV